MSYYGPSLLAPQQSAMETYSVTGSAGLSSALPPKVQINLIEIQVSSGADKSELVGGALT